MTDDFISMDHDALLREIAKLDRKLASMEKNVSNEIMDTVLKEAAGQLKDEQKRILSTAPTEGIRSLSSDLTVWKDNSSTSSKVSYHAGYPESKIGTGPGKSIKYFVVEFGRPGKRGKAKDSLGRRIGRVKPFSHIRAAWFLKKDSINRFIAQRVSDEIQRRWNQ